MVFEVACSECNGRLMVEEPGAVVACPHCGVHLSIPEEGRVETVSVETTDTPKLNEESDSASTFPGLPDAAEEDVTVPEFLLDMESPEIPFTPPDEIPFRSLEETTFDVETEPSFQLPESEASPDETPLEETALEESESAPDISQWDSDAEKPEEAAPDTVVAEAEDHPVEEDSPAEDEKSGEEVASAEETDSAVEEESAETDETGQTEDSVSDADSDASDSEASNEEPTVETPLPIETSTLATNEPSVPRSKYTLVASYASAVTLAFLIYLWMTMGPDPHQLESLPDVIPKEKTKGVIERNVVSENAPMPLGHTLELGQTQRFGNLEVTPLRVTREPLEFEHYAGETSQTRPPSAPVLKLWLRFKNVSTDQEFMPLGADLVFHRGATKKSQRMRANNFVCKIDEKNKDGNLVMVYDHIIEDVWNLKGQNIERGLEPGDAFETFIPSADEGLDALTGKLIWRVHLRKGLNAKTGWGITTLIEVEFESGEIKSGSIAPKEQSI